MVNEIKKIEELPKQLGCLPDPKDDRDHIYIGAEPEILKVMPTLEEGYNVEDEIGKTPNFNQFSTLGCTAFGLANDLSHLFLETTGEQKIFSKRYIYSQTHLPNGGAYVRDVYKLAHQQGVCEDSLMPTYKPDGSLTEEWLRNKDDITLQITTNAFENKIDEYLKIPSDDFDLLCQGIFESKGVGCGAKGVTASMGHLFELIGYRVYNGYPALIRKDSIPVWRNGKWDYYRYIIKVEDKYYQENTSGSQVELFSHWLAKKNFLTDMKLSKIPINEELLEHQYELIFHRKPDEGAKAHLGINMEQFKDVIKNSPEWKFNDFVIKITQFIKNLFIK